MTALMFNIGLSISGTCIKIEKVSFYKTFILTNSHDSHVKNKLVESGIKHHQTPVRPKGMTIGVVGLAKQKGPQYFSMCNFSLKIAHFFSIHQQTWPP
jgi:hypothetical protein